MPGIEKNLYYPVVLKKMRRTFPVQITLSLDSSLDNIRNRGPRLILSRHFLGLHLLCGLLWLKKSPRRQKALPLASISRGERCHYRYFPVATRNAVLTTSLTFFVKGFSSICMNGLKKRFMKDTKHFCKLFLINE